MNGTRHCREVKVADEFWALNHEPSPRTTVRAKGIPMKNLVPRPFWLIAKYQTGGMEVLRITLACGEEALPVFSCEKGARMFLEFGAPDGWRVRVTTAGELISVLFGPCAGVGWVAPDPLPGRDAAASVGLVSLGRVAFIRSLLTMQRLPSFASGCGAVRRPADVTARAAVLVRR